MFLSLANSVTWVASNVEGSYRRGVTLGMAIGFGNLNGAVASNVVSNLSPLSRHASVSYHHNSIEPKMYHGIDSAMRLFWYTSS